jgi:DNA-dependent RNA polymerase auxiliary subunit epsilon
MKDRISTDLLKQRINARIRKLGDSGIFISGSLVRTGRKCGNPSCRCASGGEKHPCCLLTSKVKGKTKAVYVPVDMEDEVAQWVKENKKIRQLLKEVDQLSEQLIKQHVAVRRAVARNLKLRSQSNPT